MPYESVLSNVSELPDAQICEILKLTDRHKGKAFFVQKGFIYRMLLNPLVKHC